jgi:hypothetical protein
VGFYVPQHLPEVLAFVRREEAVVYRAPFGVLYRRDAECTQRALAETVIFEGVPSDRAAMKKTDHFYTP